MISLHIDQSASKYPGTTELDRLRRYYGKWQVPETPSDNGLRRLHALVCNLFDSATSSTRLDRSQLAAESELFSIRGLSDTDSSIADHCRMHFIALAKIGRLETSALPTELNRAGDGDRL